MEQPVTGTIFHLSLPAKDLADTKQFYCALLGATPGRRTAEWIDLILFGHQVTFHQRPEQVAEPGTQGVQHFGVILAWTAWEEVCARLEASGHALELGPAVSSPTR